ncbi:MAG: ABC transporter ATP-binding protein [Bacteroidota bacterium]|nr:ABC transporter ATP-binding protein [Bacteroidota bacterium]
MSEKILEVKNLKREFVMGEETVKALKGLSFTIHSGEFVTIMGHSGSGKTTLLNILGCLDRPTDGNYYLDGVNVEELDKNSLAELRNEKIGFVFQSYNLLPRTTALENVEMPMIYNKHIPSSERRDRALEALKTVNLLNRAHHMPNQLSGGQQQRVAIARALVSEPVIILADEATGNLDTRTSYEIISLMQDLNEKGKTIVFVTHEPDIAAFSQRTILLRDGLTQKDVINTEKRSAKKAIVSLPDPEKM